MKKLNSLVARGVAALLALASCVLIPSFAHAGGLYFFDRGARPLSRGGAFVAGADDPHALWYNPAGLTWSKNQIVMDAVQTIMVRTDFTRTNTVDGNTYEYPTVKPKQTYLPIPTFGLSHKLGTKDFTFGFGVWAPNAVLLNWPHSVKTANGNEAPSTRYSLIGLKSTILANIALGLAWEPFDGLSIGADVAVVVGQLVAKTTLSACDRFVCAQPEDRSFDAQSSVTMPAVALTGNFGITYDAKLLRLGASLSLPYTLSGTADLKINLPTNPLFADATLTGSNKADMSMNFPMIIRFGSELRPVKALRMEGAFVIEKWSTQEEIKIKPKDLQIQNVTGIGNYDVGPVTIQRNMRDTWSLRGGMEVFVPHRWSPWGLKWVVRGGLAYEKGAFDSRYMTPFTLDSNKYILSGGFGVNLAKRLRFDTVLGYAFMKDQTVTNSDIRQPQAIRPTKAEYGSALGNGKYNMDALFLGGGFGIDLN